ncbi:MAG TPA: O-acetylhomoserine aminocarboxypropyltransferase [Acidimicrobiia bacterium]|jgi:O-acetylhomoserine (thiol)-lyase|nr:O-acetylhomoserine aminocarboxypropyltransferase [Acidimicrobiia bacterium]
MVQPDVPQFDTMALHAGHSPDSDFAARAVPIYQTTSYLFPDVDHAAGLFNLERHGHIYSRISNPTVAVLEERMAALEGGAGAVCAASGQAALHLAVATLLSAGDHVVCSQSVYGGTRNLFGQTLPRFGIAATFVHPRDHDGIRAAINDRTRLVVGETLGNPGLEVLDVAAVAAIAHEHGVPLLIDNTFATPYLFRPLDHGADVVTHSLTKFVGGHGIAIGGVMVDGGTFDWEGSGKFPTMTEPYPSYHGLRFAEEFGTQALAARARVEGLRDFGAAMAPATAFYLLQGVETLSLRMDRHVANTRRIIEFLQASDAVAWIAYPELPSHPDHELAKKLLPRGAGAIFSFGIKGGRDAGQRFIERLSVFSHLANVGDAKSLVIHPASTTHATMSPDELEAAGVGEDLVRLSVGLEDAADLIDDLARGLRASQKG